MAEQNERLQTEISLLESMYPEQIHYDEKSREVTYRSDDGSFTLRLPDEYLLFALPDVMSARRERSDLREPLKERIRQCEIGEEVLDSIVFAFHEIAEDVASKQADEHAQGDLARNEKAHQEAETKATIIVWLHHLLNTNKRKQALSPAPTVSGITKPGYPGVLIYSGPSNAVYEQVNELKQLNWAAFQVRLESEDEWTFAHGTGVREVEAMKDVVAEVGEVRKDVFMEAMRMK
ncbi:hypothetical protein KC340_g14563 [Hortaea werneckii]|nr:hypothetical protein KC342_g8280 [Hortaea werneckii]KAI7096562.1 hypothetical protein KC339_g10297 [Hortaea werneckii]KAI7220791.1 hypothetical protein KC365_g11898 [Hortaea werneckii]KAI7298048.1 hypothetical protein KC340_g14563 [Hortaea werneckii]KAI7394082.1 hypothetical protein KC328_g6307 [Hortaea werneckii]